MRGFHDNAFDPQTLVLLEAAFESVADAQVSRPVFSLFFRAAKEQSKSLSANDNHFAFAE
jgi:hypothetical protein